MFSGPTVILSHFRLGQIARSRTSIGPGNHPVGSSILSALLWGRRRSVLRPGRERKEASRHLGYPLPIPRSNTKSVVLCIDVGTYMSFRRSASGITLEQIAAALQETSDSHIKLQSKIVRSMLIPGTGCEFLIRKRLGDLDF